MDKFELGEIYRELRLARGLKLKDIATEHLTVSQISKFENGQCMLSADRMLLAIEGLNMTFEEFGEVWIDSRVESFSQLKTRISDLFAKQDVNSLTNLLQKVESTYKGVYRDLLSIVIKNARFAIDQSYVLEETDKELVVNYLYSIEVWTSFEIYIFSNTMNMLQVSDLVFLGNALVEKSKLYMKLPANKLRLKYTLVNLVNELIERNKLSQAIYFLNHLEQILAYFDAFEYIF